MDSLIETLFLLLMLAVTPFQYSSRKSNKGLRKRQTSCHLVDVGRLHAMSNLDCGEEPLR